MARSRLSFFAPGAGFTLRPTQLGMLGGGGFVQEAVVPGDPGVVVTDPKEPITGAQVAAAWGVTDEGIVTDYYPCNDLGAPLIPTVGAASMTMVGGPPVAFATAGPFPMDAYDKSIQISDAQAVQFSTGNGAITFGTDWWMAWCDCVLLGAAPGTARQLFGHDSTEDALYQVQGPSGRPRGVLVDSGAGTIVVPEIAINHYTGLRQTHAIIGRAGGEAKVGTNLGVGTPVSLAGVTGGLSFTAAWFLLRSSAGPACHVYNHGVMRSDNSTSQNAAFQDLWDNFAARIATWRTNTGQ